MKKIASLSLLLLLVACGEQAQKSKSQPEVVDYQAKSGEVLSSANFGSLNYDQAKIITVKIKNSGDEPLMGPVATSSDGLSVIYQNGCSLLAPQGICTAKISLNARQLPAGIYAGQISLDEVIIPVAADIQEPPVLATAHAYQVNSQSVMALDFGAIEKGQTLVKSLSILSNGAGTINSEVLLSGAGFALIYDKCSGVALSKGKTCLIKVSFSASASGNASGSLSYNNQPLPLSAEVSVPASENPQNANLAVFYNGVDIKSPALELADLVADKVVGHSFIVKNLGSAPAVVSSLSFDSGFSVSYSNCATIQPAKSCMFKTSLKPSASGEAILSIVYAKNYSAPIAFEVGGGSTGGGNAVSIIGALEANGSGLFRPTDNKGSTFVPTENFTLTSIKIGLRAGRPIGLVITDNLRLEVGEINPALPDVLGVNGYSDSNSIGTSLGVSDNYNLNAVGDSTSDHTLIFSTPIALEAGKTYYFIGNFENTPQLSAYGYQLQMGLFTGNFYPAGAQLFRSGSTWYRFGTENSGRQEIYFTISGNK